MTDTNARCRSLSRTIILVDALLLICRRRGRRRAWRTNDVAKRTEARRARWPGTDVDTVNTDISPSCYFFVLALCIRINDTVSSPSGALTQWRPQRPYRPVRPQLPRCKITCTSRNRQQYVLSSNSFRHLLGLVLWFCVVVLNFVQRHGFYWHRRNGDCHCFVSCRHRTNGASQEAGAFTSSHAAADGVSSSSVLVLTLMKPH